MAAETANRVPRISPAQDVALDNSCLIRVEVTQLRAYDRNPRQCPNSEYERIKASIRAQGLDQPLVVTCRPNESDYMLLAGGNTRLRAVLALYQETGDEAYRYLDCVFKPWAGESAVLLSHLRENELRDNLYFIDKSKAVFEVKALLEAEMQGQPLSQRRLSELITGHGLSYSQTSISRMSYTVHTLWPLIPQALLAGMGTPQIERIQGLERGARAIWCKRSLGTEAEFDDTFAALCRRYDSPEWATEVLRGALETEIADAADVGLSLVRLELDARIAGRPFPAIALDTLEQAPAQTLERSLVESSNSEPVVIGNAIALPAVCERDPASESINGKDHGNLASRDTKENNGLDPLRQQACQQATALAHAHGLGRLVKPFYEQGLGFLVQDVPEAALTDVLDEDLAHLVTAVWWQLVACAEMLTAPAVQIMTHLKEGSPLQAAVVDKDHSKLFKAIPPLEPGLIGTQLWRRLNDEDWKALTALIETYRALHRVSRESGQPLWNV